MQDIFEEIQAHREQSIQELCQLLSHPSISAQGEGLEACAALVARMMTEAGIPAQVRPTDGFPVVTGEVRAPGPPRTVLFYGHYDVQPPEPLDLWHSPPFQPTLRDGRIWARGAGDNKGQFFAHLKAVQAILRKRGTLPITVKFLIEGEEEVGSKHLRSFVEKHRDLLRADLAWTSDGPTHDSGRPLVVFGLRGLLYLELRCHKASTDVHSGNRGGVVPNPAWRLVHLLASMRDAEGRVTIEGFSDAVRPLTPRERRALAEIPFDGPALLRSLGLREFDGPADVPVYEKLMFRPNLNIPGFASGYAGPGEKTIIPCRALAKVDVRLVADQDPEDIYRKILRHLERHGFGDIEVEHLGAVPPSKTPLDHPLAPAVIRAVEEGFGERPLLLPTMGGSGPDFLFTRVLGMPSFLVPYAPADENNHAPNESITVEGFLKGIRTTVAGLYALAG